MFSLNQQDAARLIGRTARYLRDNPDCPRKEDGKYDACEIVAWMLGQAGNEDLKEEKTKEEIKVLQERCRKLENENSVQEGNLVDARDLREGLVELGSYIREAGDLLGRKSKILGRDAQGIVNAALEKYARKLDQLTGSGD